MTAKDYLKQIGKFDTIINQKKQEIDSLASNRVLVPGISYSAEKVQTSPDGTGFAGQSDKIIDITRKLLEEILDLQNQKQYIIDQIQQLSTQEYINILYQRYVLGADFEEIAYKAGYTYNYTCKLHGQALKEFEKTFL